MESVFRIGEIVAQTVAEKLTEQMADTAGRFQEAFEPIVWRLDEAVRSAKKIAKENYKTPKTGKPTSKKKGRDGDSSPPDSSSSSSDDDPVDWGDGQSDDGSTRSDSSNSILRGMEYSTRKKHRNTKGEPRKMSTLTPPVIKKPKDGEAHLQPCTLSQRLLLVRYSLQSSRWSR